MEQTTETAQPAAHKKRGLHGLRPKMALFVGVLIVVLMIADAGWNIALQQEQSQSEAREKAEVLASEMRAVWDFIDINQDVINRDDNGEFRTKTLVCVVAAKSVSTLFTDSTDYSIRFTSETPRQNANAPDDFEQEAFEAFAADSSLQSYSAVRTDGEGNRVFRYVEPLYVTESCLECHGDPAGELDQYGYEKEGMQVGEVGGAMSITEPMDIYDASIVKTVTQQLFMALIMVVACGLGIFLATSKLILRPIDTLNHAAKRIEQGDFSGSSQTLQPQVGGSDEVSEFAQNFDSMAHQLEQLYNNLDEEVSKQTEEAKILNDMLMYQQRQLKDALDRLEEEAAYKSEFFAIVSHELRTPLTSILAYSKLLLEKDELTERGRAAVTDIEANGRLLLNLVNNILTISKAEANRNEILPEAVDFVDLVGFIRSTLEPIAANKDIAITAKADADVPVSMADYEKLRRVVENLADNAIKYTHRNGYVNISVHFLPCSSVDDNTAAQHSWEIPLAHSKAPFGTIVITVADDGMGIAEEDLNEIFELYKQAGQSSMRRYRGTGLGLAVVKELTELHGGEVSVESKRKCGSTFCVRIPYIPVTEEEE